jgi:DNA-binding response OmpR family regulator
MHGPSTIMVIDESPETCALTREAFKAAQWDARVICHAKADAALRDLRYQNIRGRPVDLVIMSLYLRQESTLPLLVSIHAQGAATGNPPVVLLADAAPSTTLAQVCVSAGALHVIEKPTSFISLVKFVEELKLSWIKSAGLGHGAGSTGP